MTEVNKGGAIGEDKAMALYNKGASVAKAVTPKFVKRRVAQVANVMNRGQRLADKLSTIDRSDKKSSTFNFGAIKAGVAKLTDIKQIKDFAQIDGITQVMILIMGFLFFVIFLWCYNKITLDKQNCRNLEQIYTKFPVIRTISKDNPKYCHNLRDYYIKTAYNCCAGGKYKNDFVNVCALKNCIKQGARCLDFEIYSLDNLPVISVSSGNDYSVKESYNHVPFAKALEIISVYAFSGNTSPNYGDPLILNLRIMSNNKKIYDDMAKSLYNILSDRILGKKFSYENNGFNIGSYPIVDLMGKVVVIVDKTNPLFTDTLLNEYVNIASNSAFMRSLRFKDVKYSPDMEELSFYNQKNMSIVLPDYSANNRNFSPSMVMTSGCQFIGMSFQNFDSNFEYYSLYFDEVGSAFSLKPKRLRYTPVLIDKPPPPKPELDYATRPYNPLGENGPSALNSTV